jgi:hypothetical protein
MSVKTYGIYLAYPPNVDLRAEGLGRHLIMLLKGAERLPDVRFAIACPSWSRKDIKNYFETEGLSFQKIEIHSELKIPYLLRIFMYISRRRKNLKKGTPLFRYSAISKKFISDHLLRLLIQGACISSAISLLVFAAKIFVSLIILLPLIIISTIVLILLKMVKKAKTNSRLSSWMGRARKTWVQSFNYILSFAKKPYDDGWMHHIFIAMYDHEMMRLNGIIAAIPNIKGWYCPTAFWPSFNKINKPRLVCVPDVVLRQFPVGFARNANDRFLETFNKISKVIKECRCIATYSESVKWGTLVDHYAVPAESVTVIPHAPIDLKKHIDIKGFTNDRAVVINFCEKMLGGAIGRSKNNVYIPFLERAKFKYLFYASQLRPNKNIITLLRAFDYLLRQRYLGHKLILTGQAYAMPEIMEFILNNKLECEVLFLNNLSLSELAACYKLADIAVNPSLSEGGLPFTFSEALSVDTPVVMSRIPVSEEVLTDPKLQSMTFFDPYDWFDCAKKIEWGVMNRQILLNSQRKAYVKLSKRTWTDVAKDYIDAIDKQASQIVTA